MKSKYFEWGTIGTDAHFVEDTIRLELFTRDGFKCQDCGLEAQPIGYKWRTGKLHAHHLDLNGQHKDANDNIDNLITLCTSCHSKRHARHRKNVSVTQIRSML
jgi:5-methylcytosine-specific restriction endonuclease McrA